MTRAKLRRTANREIFVSSEATGAGILDLYSEHRNDAWREENLFAAVVSLTCTPFGPRSFCRGEMHFAADGTVPLRHSVRNLPRRRKEKGAQYASG